MWGHLTVRNLRAGGLGAPLRRGGWDGPLSIDLCPLLFEAAIGARASGLSEPAGKGEGVTGRRGGDPSPGRVAAHSSPRASLCLSSSLPATV